MYAMRHCAQMTTFLKTIYFFRKAYEFAGEKNVAFMKSLPHSLYKGTSINDSYKKWLKSKIPLKIETMESVFSGKDICIASLNVKVFPFR